MRTHRVLTAEEMRACDRHAIEVLGIPGVVLMETAGRAAAAAAGWLLRERGGKRAVVYCGPGNNGGDGFVIARCLHAAGVPVSLVLAKGIEDCRGDAAINAHIARRLGLPMRVGPSGQAGETPSGDLEPEILDSGDLVVDALLGTGLVLEVGGVVAELIEEILDLRARGCAVLAVDIPSGCSSDDGRVMGRSVAADLTVTFGYLKRGLLMYPCAGLAGEVIVADIGLPPEVEETLTGPPCVRLDESWVQQLLPGYSLDSHKGTFGHVLVVAGSKEKPGAAALVCQGSLKAGAGLVTLASRPGGDACVRATLPEVMGIELEGEGPLCMSDLPALLAAAEGKQAIAIGPGVPRGEETGALIEALCRESGLLAVIDADGLNSFGEDLSRLRGLGAGLVLTPHPKEMARLIGQDVSYVQTDRLSVAARFAEEHGLCLVLKGSGSVVAGPQSLAVCSRGGPSLATGGTGDVLTGVIAALLAAGMVPVDACRAGVLAHALAGERAGEGLGRAGSLATDIAHEVGSVFKSWNW